MDFLFAIINLGFIIYGAKFMFDLLVDLLDDFDWVTVIIMGAVAVLECILIANILDLI